MEWGNFWADCLPRTYADEGLDHDSVNPGDQVGTGDSRNARDVVRKFGSELICLICRVLRSLFLGCTWGT